ncbi:ABC-three component system protein [Tenacibaculum maritimum]|uniref:ABC-three component system protein n=1 Tax=Tenacibaculum maritimum TaxID=107401 RepID=UPI0012E42E4B|nr:ABC-three component system protein [Tenacibaculum maritimum]MCD9584254.1 restriction endonuclease [Tenacibaculum maritimum]MCD9619675.1 restriction endonuclease [Tenacibaculum maritimum]MCD9625877.1 restriction endonuclease [Tenacibaculum maritimum]MCD9628829.1 restriction endonuclease [Tenacibaculum maritimum]MCD9631891.1 restriction endonuclease [Tenacibaculum maritimum]
MSKKETYSTSYQTTFGKRILPIKRIELFSPDEWEEFIEEWLETKKSKYIEVEKLGGSGDMGRDVVAYISDKTKPNYKWNCYQCKHYDKPLMPSQVYAEFGKIIYYTFLKKYPVPEKYFFVAPKNCGTSLSTLLTSSKELKKNIKDNWSKNIENSITNTSVKLEGKLLKYFNNFNFGIFSKIVTKDIIKEHANHRNHITRFGGGLPEREKLDEKSISKKIQKKEINYVDQLIKAYNTESKKNCTKPNELDEKYSNHFNRARLSFHHSEQLRNFSRDSLPINTFENFQDEIFSSIIDMTEDDYDNDFKKVKEVEKEVRKVIISSNPLKDIIIVNDKVGVCHQLVNDKKIYWVKDEE